MKIEKLLPLKILILAIVFSACQKSAAENEQIKSEFSPLAAPTLELTATPSPEINSPIRKIDFKNFTYPFTEEVGEFMLKNGEKPRVPREDSGVSLWKVEYSDVTNDAEEEAIVFMSVETGGSSMPNIIFIYTLKKDKPKLLWHFLTGDRAEGGLKNVYAENSELVVETFGDNKFENDEWEFNFPKNKFTGYCCPSAYTKIYFKWNGKKFVVQGEPELFDYDWKNQNKITK